MNHVKVIFKPKRLFASIGLFFAGVLIGLTAQANPQHYTPETGVPAGLPLMAHHSPQTDEEGGKVELVLSSRFGIQRDGVFHKGLDLNGLKNGRKVDFYKLYARTNSTYGGLKWGGDAFSIERPNGDRVLMGHASPSLGLKRGQQFGPGSLIGREDDRGASNPHLHLTYMVPKRSRSRGLMIGRSGLPITRYYAGDGANGITMAITDPTPYYAQDFVFELSYGNEYLGGSARTQFNALYGADLPVAANIKKPTKKLPTVPRFANTQESLTPDEIARENMNLANAAMMADDMGYDISGRMVSHRILASIFSTEDGASWDIAERIAPPAKVSDMTPEELIEYVATRRYGDSQWFVDMAKMNMRGLQTELIAMQAEKKILEKELIMAERAVEKQLAAYLSIKNKSQEMLNQAMYDGIIANAIPDIIAAHLEKKGDEFVEMGGFVENVSDVDLANLPNDMQGLVKQLIELIAADESRGSYYAFNQYGCGKSIWVKPTPKNSSYDFPNRTVRQVLAQGARRCAADGVYAAGKYQMIPTTLDAAATALNLKDKPFNAETQEKMGVWLLTQKQPKLKAWFQGRGSLEAAKVGIAAEWRSIGHPNKCTPSLCLPYSGTKDKAQYSHTVKVWTIMAKMDQLIQQNKTK